MTINRSESQGMRKAMAQRARGFLTAFVEDECGQNQLEFGLVAALVSLCAVASMKGLADAITGLWQSVSTGIAGA